jgi:hypothetical protein
MSTTDLLKPILDGGIRSANFFNGRLLSGEDLTTEQKANQEARRQLGQAIGEGIAYGLEVFESTGASTKALPVVTIKAGLAINRKGRTLMLPADTDVALIRESNANGTTAAVGFGDCQPPEGGVYIAGDGVYLLTIGPASGPDGGRAPVSGLGNVIASCNTKYLVDGVRFRLLELPLTSAELSDTNRLRNRVAYKCFGTTDGSVSGFFRNPFGPVVTKYGLLDELRPNRLTDCEVPLALIYWTIHDGIKFIDLWAVRRRLIEPATARGWPLLIGDRRVSEAEAMALQFEDHIQDIRATETNPSAIVATQRFALLPAVGLLPVTGIGSPGGFNPATFFGARASTSAAMTDGNLLRHLMHEALYHEPIDLSASGKIQLYLIFENVKAVEAQQTNQLALVFASSTLPYRGIARFGYAGWSLDRFAPHII